MNVSAAPLKPIYSVSATPKETGLKKKERPSTVSLAAWQSDSFYGGDAPNF
jgi:hypothetical protein